MVLSIQQLKDRFAIEGLSFDEGLGGLTRISVSTPVSSGEVYLHGGHVTKFQPRGHDSVLWISQASHYEAGKPIRGGVPICFPWFGPHPSDVSVPSHGWARLTPWNIAACGLLADGGVAIDLAATITDFALAYRIEFGSRLRLCLSVRLTPGTIAKRRFEEALHTYLNVGDIHSVSISGLEGAKFIDKVGGQTQREATGQPISFSGETDRVYTDTSNSITLRDRKLNRSIKVTKAGSNSTIIWNPWIDKSQKMADFGDDEWQNMVCIESGNVAGNAVELAPGQTHVIETEIEAVS